MADSFQVRFEVHVEEDGRWTIFTDAPSKLRAIEEAQNLLAGDKYSAAKVTEDRGQAKEILVWHEEAGERADKAVTISTNPKRASFLAASCANIWMSRR